MKANIQSFHIIRSEDDAIELQQLRYERLLYLFSSCKSFQMSSIPLPLQGPMKGILGGIQGNLVGVVLTVMSLKWAQRSKGQKTLMWITGVLLQDLPIETIANFVLIAIMDLLNMMDRNFIHLVVLVQCTTVS